MAAIVAVTGLSPAVAQAAMPPSLTGEYLNGTEINDTGFASICASGAPDATYGWSYQGVATGPYTGTFVAQGNVSFTITPTSPGSSTVTVTGLYVNSFTITAPNGTVTGTQQFDSTQTSSNGSGTCTTSANGTGFSTNWFASTYKATITTPSGTYVDAGQASSDFTASQVSGVLAQSSISDGFGSEVPWSSGWPGITGPLNEAQTLNESHAAWTNSPTSYTYQWQRCDATGTNCAALTDATTQSYTLTAADVGSTIRVEESASNSAGTGGPATSPTTYVIQGPLPPPLPPPAPNPAPAPTVSPPSSLGGSTPPASGPPVAPLKVRLTFPAKLSSRELLRHGAYTWPISVPSAGEVIVRWHRRGELIASGRARFTHSGASRLTIRLTKTGRRLLRTHRSLRVAATASYTPNEGPAVWVTRTVQLLA